MVLEELTINEVQTIRTRAVEPPLDSPSSNPIPTVLPRQDLKGKIPVESVPRANPRTKCFKCRGYEHVEKFCPSKFRTLFLDDQSNEVHDESKKVIVFIGNAGVILRMTWNTRKFLVLSGVLLSFVYPRST